MLDKQQSLPPHERRRPRPGGRPRDRRPQGRLRHHARRGASGGSTPRCRRTSGRAASARRTPRTGGGDRASPYAAAATSVDASRVVGRQRHRPVGQHGARRRDGSARRRRACSGATPAGRRTRGRPSADRSRATRPSRWPPGCVAAAGSRRTSGADPVGHMLFLQHEGPDLLARTRWLLEPVDYLTMRFTGVPAASLASMTGAWLTDNRSLATLAYDDVLVRAGRRRRVAAAAAGRDGFGRRPGAARGGRRARHPGRRRRRHRPARPALRRRRRRRGRARRAARLDRHHRLDQRAGAAQEDRRDAAAGQRAGPRQRVVPAGQQPGLRRPQPRSGGATRSRPTHVVRRAAGRGRGDAAGRGRRACSRPG